MSVTMKDYLTPIPLVAYLKGGAACFVSEMVNTKVIPKEFQVPYSAVAIVAGSILYCKGYVAKYPWIGSFCLQAAVPLALKAVNLVTPKGNCIWDTKNSRWQVKIMENLSETTGKTDMVSVTYHRDEQTKEWKLGRQITLNYTVNPLFQLRVRQACRALFSGAALGLPLLAYKGTV